MISRQQAFVGSSADIVGTVTRFAIVDCRLDPSRGVAVVTVALEWVLRDRRPEPDHRAPFMPWKATFFRRDETGCTVTVAEVQVSGAGVVEQPLDRGVQSRFRVGVEIEWPLTEPRLELEATIRRFEVGTTTPPKYPHAELTGYASAPDLDPEHGAFPSEAIRWLHGVNVFARGDRKSARPPAGAPPQAPAPPARMAPPAAAPGPMPAAREESLESAAPSTMSAPTAEPVDVAVFCPPGVGRGTSFLVQAFLYPPAQAELASARAREADGGADRRGVLSLPQDLPHGTRIDLRLEMPGLRIDEPDTVLVWRGESVAAQFEVAVPDDLALGKVIGRIRVTIAGVPCGTLRFQIVVAATAISEPARAAEVFVRRYRRAFVSYSSKDRAEVLRRVQAFRIAGVSVFQDVLDLEPGERWERELYREIDQCDVVLLFWSRAAAESPWVAKEIDYALARKQGHEDRPPDIQPVPIEGPPIPPPPEKLRHLHFNDALLAHIAAAQAVHP